MQQRNLLLFFVVVSALMFGYITVRPRLFPPVPVAEKKEGEATTKPAPKPAARKDREPTPVALPAPPSVTPATRLLTLGADNPDSPFEMQVVLDPLGGGVRSVRLNKFKAADPFSGRPAGDEETLPLVNGDANRIEPSHLLYHCDPNDSRGDRPVDTLGRRTWEPVLRDGQAVVEDTAEDGARRQRVAFRTTIDDVTITKTFTLVEGEYHLGLQVDLERAATAGKGEVRFRYQLTGAKGLPVEGKWYTGTFRNALIGVEDDRGYIDRKLQDLRQIGVWAGGNRVDRPQTGLIRYAGVAVQYFASVLVTDEDQDGSQKDKNFVAFVRPTLERGVVRGRIKAGTSGLTDRLVLRSDDGKTETTVFLPPHLRGRPAPDGTLTAAIYRPLAYDEALKECPKLAEDVRYGGDAEGTHALWEDDITVRLTTEPVMLAAGKRVTHRYLVYNGPVKPSLLGQLRGERQVDPQLIDRYVDTLKLNTLTDYPSPGPLSAFSSFIGWTWLIIKCTNLMHWVLGKMTLVLPSYGLSIILLTLLVRLAMFPLSRKQALMTLKMSALQPELKKLAAKYKDDKQAYAQAQMALFRQHGVNPFGSCWILLLQMPIFMGLYFALQESIQFRLAAFWPTWITNLAAPDMMFEWGRRIPLLSNDAAYGGMLYLGPYFNLLPIITVALMLAQQKMMTPPAADAEQEMQQKMMRIMMVVFGLFFYRLASGLCLYIIVSTLWGFAERKLLPKAQLPKLNVDLDRTVATLTDGGQPTTGSTAVTAPSPVTTGKKPGKNRRKDRGKGEKETPSTKFGQMRQRLSDWWTDLLEQARKK